MTILEKLVENARDRVREAQKRISAFDMQTTAEAAPKGSFAFEIALKKPGLSFICECKKASPSRGTIADDYPYLAIAKEYERAGADCVSVLTEPTMFLGADEHLREIASAVAIPCLRKDFIVDSYSIYEAKLLGASAVLLICAVLDERRLRELIGVCDGLGLSALVETRSEFEVEQAVRAGARVVGVNNRNLDDFSVDFDRSRRLRALVPRELTFVAESGVRNAEDAAKLRAIGADAVLIGETLMRTADKTLKLRELRGVL